MVMLEHSRAQQDVQSVAVNFRVPLSANVSSSAAKHRASRQRRFRARCVSQGSCNPHLQEPSSVSNPGMQERQCTTVYAYNCSAPVVETQSHSVSGSPLDLLSSQEHCNEVIQQLETGDQVACLTVLLWFHKATRQLALSKHGCRVVQKALEVTGGSDKGLIIAELKDHIIELYESPHGNHVLSRVIELLPAAKTSFIIHSLLGKGVVVSRHKFGCRIMCRLIEHHTEDHIGSLLDEVLEQADTLSRHAYGNFVVQHILEHTSQARRSAVLSRVLPGFVALAMHRTGSLVAQKVLNYCSVEGQKLALCALRGADGETSVIEIACSHYGSYVIEQLAGLRQSQSVAEEIAAVLAKGLPEHLAHSPHAQRVALAFGLGTIEHDKQICSP